MTPEKDMLARQLIRDINEKTILSFGNASAPCPVIEILAWNEKYPDPIGEDKDGNNIYPDSEGHNLFSTYRSKVAEIVYSVLGTKMEGLSGHLNFNPNYDALKIHRDSFSDQYQYLSSLPPPVKTYYLFQDLTLMDWQMAKGTFAGTLVQDGSDGDRFIMAVFPGEIVGTVYTEPCVSKDKNSVIVYPGRISFPYHSSVAPTDFDGSTTVGSWKGKRISTSTRGVVQEEEIILAAKNATFLPINRPTITIEKDNLRLFEYPDTIKIQDISQKLANENNSLQHKLPDQENLTILESSPQDFSTTISYLKKNLGVRGSNVKIFHLIKRDGGFSRFSKLDLEIPENSTVVILNKSKLPENYKYYTISKIWTDQGLPWIQLFNFSPHQAMIVSGRVFRQLSMTPLEELFFRNAQIDEENAYDSVLTEKLVCELILFVIN